MNPPTMSWSRWSDRTRITSQRYRDRNYRRRYLAARIEGLEPRLMLASDLLLADPLTESILRFDATSGSPLGAFVASGSGGLVDPHDPTFGPDGNLYVISNDPGAAKILRFDGDNGAFMDTFVNTGSGGFAGASGIEFGPNGDLFVVTNAAAGVLRFDGTTGNFLSAIGAGDVSRASGIGFGFDNRLYVLDSDGLLNTFADRILRYDPSSGGLIDEFVAPGQLDDVALFRFGPDGHLYVPEVAARSVLRFSGTSGDYLGAFIPADSGEVIFDIAFGPDGNAYTSGSDIKRFDSETGAAIDTWIDGVTGTLTFLPEAGSPHDLAVVDLQVPLGIVQQEDLSITYTVTNGSGSDISARPWEDVVYLSTDDVFDPSDRELGRVQRTMGLDASDSYTETLTTTLPSIPLGDYHVFVIADRRGMVMDSARANNLRRSDQTMEVFAPLASSHDREHSIAVGRTLSAYTTTAIANNQLTITYTIYNLTDGYAEGAQLTTTLEDQVTFVGASQTPGQNGQELSWNLGTITPYGRTSVDLTVALSGPGVTQVDQGPRVTATIDTVSMEDELGAAVLRTDVIDPALIASTVDANSRDPFVQAKAAELNQDASQIFAYLAQEIGFHSYRGSLRGARGTLWTGAANSLDEANLGVALMRASGIPARYAEGTLGDSLAQQLILSMFPDNFQVVGYVPTGSAVGDPASDSQLLMETREHHWFQYDVGSGFTDADTSFDNAQPGETFTAVTSTFTEVPNSLRHQVLVTLTAETWSQASALFGFGDGIGSSTVLTQSFSTAELVGKSIAVGNVVIESSLGALIFNSQTTSYTPYLDIGDEASLPGEKTETFFGTTYQEVLTNVPFGNQVVTGLVMRIDLVNADDATESFERSLLDRIGFAARQGLTSANVSVDPSGPPAFASTDVWTLKIQASTQSAAAARLAEEYAVDAFDTVNAISNASPALQVAALIAQSRAALASYSLISDLEAANLARAYSVAAYFDAPRITMFVSKLVHNQGRSTTVFEFDLIRDTMRAIASPGQNLVAPKGFALVRGIFDSFLEAQSVPVSPDGVNVSSANIIQMSVEQGIPLISIASNNLSLLQTLDLPAEAKARITINVQSGLNVVVPAKAIEVDGNPITAWWVGNPETGEILSQGMSGGYQGLSFATAVTALITTIALNIFVANLSNLAADYTGNESLRTSLVKVVALSFINIGNLLVNFLANLGVAGATSPLGPLAKLDPVVAPLLVDLNLPFPTTAGSTGSNSIPVAATLPGLTVVVASSTPSVTTDQNSAVTFEMLVQTSFSDTYTLVAEAPRDWTVVVDDDGIVTVTPAAGVQSGIHTIHLFARSTTNPHLLAHDEVTVNVNATTPGLELEVTPDEFFFVSVDGGQLPSVFRAEIRNLGSDPETVELSVASVPPGFSLVQSSPQVTIPPGRTAIVGFHFEATGPLPPPGTILMMDVTANNVGSTLSETVSLNFTIPEVHGVRLTLDPATVTTTPGLGVAAVLRIESRGNVDETVVFTLDASAGLSVDGLQTISVDAGQVVELPLMLTPDLGTPLNSSLSANITASFDGREPVALEAAVRVAAPGVVGIGQAATAARTLGNDDLANRLDDLGIALTELAQDPASLVHRTQSLSSLDSILTLLAVDEFLAPFVEPLSTARDQLEVAPTPVDVQVAIQQLGQVLDRFGETVSNRAAFDFSLFLNPSSQIAQPQTPARFELLLHHIGLFQGTYNVNLTGVPEGIAVDVSDPQVTLNRDDFATVVILLTPMSPDELPAFDFTIDVSVDGVSEVSKSIVGSMTARREVISIVSVTAAPPFTDAGGLIEVSARLLNSVNRMQTARASFVVRDDAGQQVGIASAPVDVNMNVQASLLTLPLGSIDTTGLNNGNYTIAVTLTDIDGAPIPGATGTGSFLVGLPVTASVDVSPDILPPGNQVVDHALQIESLAPFVSPPSLIGLSAVAGASDVVANGDFMYVAGTAGISVFDIAGENLQDPQLLRVVDTTTSILEIRGDLLVSILSRPGGGSTRLDMYSLTDPSNPTLLGTSGDVPYGSAADVVVTETHAFVVLVNIIFFSNLDLFDHNGGVIAINISDPANPFFDGDAVAAAGTPAGRDGVNDGVLFNENGTNNDFLKFTSGIDQSGGNQNTWNVVQASPSILLISGSTATGTDTQAGTGVVRVVDISDPRNMQLVRDLAIPGTVHVLGMAASGNRALIAASEGGISDFTPGFPFAGDVVLATLDLSDPANPTIVHREVLERAERGFVPVAALGGGLFAVSDLGPVNEPPLLFLVDTNDPDDLGVTSLNLPAEIRRLSGSDELIFAVDNGSVAIYQVPTDEPLTLTGQVPIVGGVRGVAARDDIAYASGTNGIQIIDYADPENPMIVGKIPGNHFGARIQDNVLLALRPSGASFILDVFAIHETPLAPPLIGSSPVINYGLVGDLTSNSTHAFVGQFGVCFFIPSNDAYRQLGDLISISLNLDSVDNPTTASPALDNVLFNTHGDNTFDPADVSGCAENGGDHLVYGVSLANAQTAYLATTTATGGDTQTGVGQIKVVDVTDATSPSVVRELDIPGTVLALSVGISGNVGVVIGSTGGFQDNPFDILTGNLSVTTLDVSDPLNPRIITSQVLDRISSTFWVNFANLGDGVFAFSNLGFDDGVANPAVIVIDASNPRVPQFGQSEILVDLVAPNSLSTDGQRLFTADSNGVSIYTINPLPGVPVTASVQIPNGSGVDVVPDSFNISPTEIISGVDFDTYVFDLTLRSSQTTETIRWQSTVDGLKPGESRPVTLGTTIDFAHAGTPGSFTLPQTSVVAEQVLSLLAAEQAGRPGEPINYSVMISNPSTVDVTYDLSVIGVPASWVTVDAPVVVLAGSTATATVQLMSSPFDVLADYDFVVNATVDQITTSVIGTLTLSGEPVLPAIQAQSRGVVVSLTPTLAVAGQGTAATYVARVYNVGSQSDEFELSISGLPNDFQVAFAADVVNVPPGTSNYRDVQITIVPPIGTLADEYAFDVNASPVTDPGVTTAAAGSLVVVETGVSVDLTPGSGEPDSTFQLIVTNTGTIPETFDLTLAAPAALVATLDVTSVTLEPNQSQTVSIDVGGIDFALPGSLQLLATATSRTNEAVVDVDSADVQIVPRRGLSLGSEQNLVRLPAPGETSFALVIDNLGNQQDEYTATIINTSGPVSASLLGTDGQPTASLPLFILPGLSRGVIALSATLDDFGTAQVTVEVRSVFDPTLFAIHTVTVSSDALLDYGDAPDGFDVAGVAAQYATLAGNDGARHVLGSGLQLGLSVDAETDGQPTAAAAGDGADDDGVIQIASLVATASGVTIASYLVNASSTGKLDVWIDFDHNGQFDHPSEHLGNGTSKDIPAGNSILALQIPTNAVSADSFVRFRLSTSGGLLPTGEATDGEVEDYVVSILDGVIGADAQVSLIAGDLNVISEVGEVVVDHASIELFRSPSDSLDSLTFLGTSADNLVSIGNLSSALSAPTSLGYLGGGGIDTLRLTGSDQSIDLRSAVSFLLQEIEIVDVVGTGQNALVLDRAGVLAATDADMTLVVVHNEDDPVDYSGVDWVVQAPIFVDGGQRHLLTNGDATVQTINTRPWTNPLEPTDVNRSGDTTALDALQIINFLGRNEALSVPLLTPTSPSELSERYYDVNLSLTASALDALQVINFLAREFLMDEDEQVPEIQVEPLSSTIVPPVRVNLVARKDNSDMIRQREIEIPLWNSLRTLRASAFTSSTVESTATWYGRETTERLSRRTTAELESIDQSLVELFS